VCSSDLDGEVSPAMRFALLAELLAVASMAVLSIYLRQRGSPESKPVGSPHHTTGVEG